MNEATNEMVSKAIGMATLYHTKQNRWNGDPYILHPLRVMLKMKTNSGRIAAVLHDIVEDTSYNEADLRNDFPKEIADSVMLLTHTKGIEYFDYIGSILGNDLARTVKIADIEDNLDLWDLEKGQFGLYVDGKHMDRINRYLSALHMLRDGIPIGCRV